MKEETVETVETGRNIRVAVYGTLRRGFGNHRLLTHAEFLGEFVTEPIYSLYNLGGYPGLKQDGETAVTMEVYAVNEVEARQVDNLEGYSADRDSWFYDKINIETPFGEAGVYIYIPAVRPESLIESGDYTSFIREKRAQV